LLIINIRFVKDQTAQGAKEKVAVKFTKFDLVPVSWCHPIVNHLLRATRPPMKVISLAFSASIMPSMALIIALGDVEFLTKFSKCEM